MKSVYHCIQHPDYHQEELGPILLSDVEELLQSFQWQKYLDVYKGMKETTDDVCQPALQFYDGEYNLVIWISTLGFFDAEILEMPASQKKVLGIKFGPATRNFWFPEVLADDLPNIVAAFFRDDIDFYKTHSKNA